MPEMIARVGLFLGASPHFGGTFQYNQSLLHAMSQFPRDRYQPVVGYAHSAWPEYLAQLGLETSAIPFGFWGRPLAQLLRFSRLAPRVQAMVAMAHPAVRALVRARCDLWIFPSHDPWSYLAPVSSLATLHDLMHRYESRFPEAGNRWESSWRDWNFSRTCSAATGVLVDSTIGREQLVESYRISPDKVHLLPYVVPPYLVDYCDNIPPDETELPLPGKYFFYPAQFWEHKNHKRLILALDKVRQNYPDVRLVLVGSRKNGYESTLGLVNSLGLQHHVQFLGYLSDNVMATLYRRARALVMPTFYGPTNIPPLEAMYLGCPMAVSGIYGMPEQVQGAALLFDPESVDSIAQAMARLWSDDELCRDLVERGRIVSARWTHEHFGRRLAEIVGAVLGTRNH